ncbi:hypothetical protein CRUP_035523 [Coryphaenoides rupestris]|nr:hypothetical protein CRUP_035523 [Coryphaenoides rupestris]
MVLARDVIATTCPPTPPRWSAGDRSVDRPAPREDLQRPPETSRDIMAQQVVKATAGDVASGSHPECGDMFSDVATVSSTADIGDVVRSGGVGLGRRGRAFLSPARRRHRTRFQHKQLEQLRRAKQRKEERASRKALQAGVLPEPGTLLSGMCVPVASGISRQFYPQSLPHIHRFSSMLPTGGAYAHHHHHHHHPGGAAVPVPAQCPCPAVGQPQPPGPLLQHEEWYGPLRTIGAAPANLGTPVFSLASMSCLESASHWN